MQLFFYDNLLGETFTFNEEESKHCIKVLRHKIGDTLLLIDGKGRLAEAVIDQDHPKQCSGRLLKVTHFEPTLPYQLRLSIAPTKQHERIDWLVEKAVEMGVHHIGFIQCQNSERPRINLERLHKIAISALKQSKQYYLPSFSDLQSFKEAITQSKADLKLIAYCLSEQDKSLFSFLQQQPKTIHLVVGPEGDFTPAEITLAQSHGFDTCSLGKHILRTETAALFGIATAAAVLSRTET
jgi:16S rRNA (uracil1498-N3)-methyltransferase